MLNPSDSREKVIVQGIFQDKSEFDSGHEIQAVLDVISKGKKANLFSEVAKYYRDNKDIFLFVAMLRDKEQLEKILSVISEGCGVHAKKQFIAGMNVFLDGINTGERNARDFLSEELSHSDLVAFFNGPRTARQDQVRNIYKNLNINAIKLGQVLETGSFFSRRIKRMEEEKSEIKNVHIFANGKKILTIERNEKQQRSYSFTKFAICDIEISWNAKDESGKDLNCVVVISINPGQVSIKKSTINGRNVGSKSILELAKQNEVVLMKDLHEVLGECLVRKKQCEKKENIQPCEDVVVPDSVLDGVGTTKLVAPSVERQLNIIH